MPAKTSKNSGRMRQNQVDPANTTHNGGSQPSAQTASPLSASRPLESTLERLAAKARESKRLKNEALEVQAECLDYVPHAKSPDVEPAPADPNGSDSTKKNRGTPSPELVRKAELRLLEKEQLGLFDSFPIQPGNEFPTLLARLPIFPAIARARQQRLLDADNALPFETPFGRGRRHGPPVSVEDEDCLIALIRLRNRCLIGEGGTFPVPIGTPHFTDEKGRASVHVVCCTLSQVLAEMGQCDSGRNFDRALKSFKRLAAMVVELETKKSDRYFGKSTKGMSFKIVDIVWEAFEMQGLILAQFPPVVVNWLENHASYIQWDVRRKLTGRNARALHRFLSTQPKTYDANMLWIAETIGWEGDKRRMRTAFQAILEQFVKLNWIEGYEISGTGRRIPYRIHVWR